MYKKRKSWGLTRPRRGHNVSGVLCECFLSSHFITLFLFTSFFSFLFLFLLCCTVSLAWWRIHEGHSAPILARDLQGFCLTETRLSVGKKKDLLWPVARNTRSASSVIWRWLLLQSSIYIPCRSDNRFATLEYIFCLCPGTSFPSKYE